MAVFAGMAEVDLAVSNDHELDIKSTMMYLRLVLSLFPPKPIEGVSERILVCAREEFLEKGYSEASLRTPSNFFAPHLHRT